MATVLFRKSSGEGLKYSVKGQSFRPMDVGAANEFDKYFGVAIDPAIPDGMSVRDLSGSEPGPMRVLGLAKHYDEVLHIWRNATQAEIDTYATLEQSDINNADVEVSRGFLKPGKFSNSTQRKFNRALLRFILKEVKQTNTKVNALARGETVNDNLDETYPLSLIIEDIVANISGAD